MPTYRVTVQEGQRIGCRATIAYTISAAGPVAARSKALRLAQYELPGATIVKVEPMQEMAA